MRLAVAMQLQVTWRDDQFNTPSAHQTRFTIMEKYPSGWKLTGLGTGP